VLALPLTARICGLCRKFAVLSMGLTIFWDLAAIRYKIKEVSLI
jgi:hypothetical protein